VDIGDLRSEYSGQPFRRSDLDPDPTVQFARWFEQAREVAQPEVNACALATMGLDGRPSARTVLLKYFDGDGFVFFTNLESRKAREIEGHRDVGLCFTWHIIQRQVRVLGVASALSESESDAYFATRPRASQIGAWASPQSEVIADRAVLEARVRDVEQRFADQPVPRPPNWGGFRVVPDEMEFWQGRRHRLHDRFRYLRTGEGIWHIERLAP
jgi:pyridoxamine 5'-phosphate oxidase